MTSRLRKAERIVGHHLVLRNAREDDAAFILALRMDARKSRHLSATQPELAAQIAWLRRYALGADQAYFIIEDRRGDALGTVRLYDARGDSFCWGSWIMRDGAPSGYAIESALIVYRYALALGFTAAHFDVRKRNQSVWKFHERFGAVRVSENDDDYFYTIDRAAIEASLLRYARFLPDGIRIEASDGRSTSTRQPAGRLPESGR